MTAPKPSETKTRSEHERDDSHEPKFRHRRGEVWLVASDPDRPSVGTELWSNRPAVIMSNNVINGRSGFAQVVYLTTSARKRSGPTHVQLPAFEGKGDTMALCEQVHTVDASRLRKKMGTVPQGRMRDLDAAVALSLSIGRNPDTHGLFRKWEEHVKLNGIDIQQEIDALSGRTETEQIEAYRLALELVTQQRDAYRDLYEISKALPDTMDRISES